MKLRTINENTDEPVWHDAGHDCPLSPDGNWMIDNRGEFAICHWDILTLSNIDGSWEYSGDINHFDELPAVIEDLMTAIRANAIGGFAIKPSDDQGGDYQIPEPSTNYDEQPEWTDPGYDQDIIGEPGTDLNGRPLYNHWDIDEITSDGSTNYGGDVRDFNDLIQSLESLIDAMKYNYLHGFIIQPSLDQY